MWNTDDGIRKLSGLEKDLFVSGVISLHEKLTHNKRWKTDVSVFDSLPTEIKPWVLLDVADALTGNRPAPELRAWNEGAVLAVFNTLEIDIDREITFGGVAVRRRVHKTWRKLCYEPEIDDEPKGGVDQSPTLKDMDVWYQIVERLADRILHDRDMEADDLYLDLASGRSGPIKKAMDIPDDYYVAVPPLYTEKDRALLERWLKRFTSKVGHSRARRKRGAGS